MRTLGFLIVLATGLVLARSYLIHASVLESKVHMVLEQNTKHISGHLISGPLQGIQRFDIRYEVPQEESDGHHIHFLRESQNPNIYVEPIPNFVEYWDGEIVLVPETEIRINSGGFRGGEYSVEKPNNTYRIIALGDGFTLVLGLNLNESWPWLLESKLNQMGLEKNVEALNLAVPGQHTLALVERFKETGLKYKPDLVIVQLLGDRHLINDTLWYEIYEGLREKHLGKLDETNRPLAEYMYLETLTDNIYFEMIANQSYEEAYAVATEPMGHLITLLENEDIGLIVVMLYANDEEVRIWRRISKERNFSFINLRKEVYSKYPLEQMEMHRLFIHPTAFACDKISDRIIEEMLITEYMR